MFFDFQTSTWTATGGAGVLQVGAWMKLTACNAPRWAIAAGLRYCLPHLTWRDVRKWVFHAKCNGPTDEYLSDASLTVLGLTVQVSWGSDRDADDKDVVGIGA